MSDRLSLADLSGPELERRLTDLGPYCFPATPDLADRVRMRLENEAATTLTPTTALTPNPPPRHAQRAPGTRYPARRAGRGGYWLAAALLLIAIAGGLALFPEARDAIADRLGLRGVLIEWVEEAPTPEPSPLGTSLLLGRAVTLTEAREAVDFPILVPTAAGFDAPREIYLLAQDEGAMVSFVYPAASGLPESEVTGVGALLTQFQGAADRNLIEKGLPDGEGATATRLESVTVGGEPGFWISGAPHGFFFVCYDVGECRQERYRLAGDVLLWERDGLTLRLESGLGREDALTIAESVRAPE